MPVLDMLCRDGRITRVTLIEPDVYKPHNVERHVFPPSAVGELKAVLAEDWLHERRPELEVRTLVCDLLDAGHQAEIDQAAAAADLGVCAADNEQAKYYWDALMRRHKKPWTLGEVLSGGIGGFVHWFAPGGPCYGCVASYLQRSIKVEKPKAPDYSQPGGAVAETTIPASKAAIEMIASLHSLMTLQIVDCTVQMETNDPSQIGNLPSVISNRLGFTSLLLTLQRAIDVYDEAFRPYRFRISRAADCLICRPGPTPSSSEELDVASDQALVRLGDA